MKTIKIYVAGKMENNSSFGRHDWRDEFIAEISKLTSLTFINFDPAKGEVSKETPEIIFARDVHMISQIDVLLVYLSDDISIGGSQEILIAKYFTKPVIALAPKGGKFNGGTKKIGSVVMEDFKHPFVFSTCDVVCGDIQEVGEALKNLNKIKPKTIDLISEANKLFKEKHLKDNIYLQKLI